MKLLYYLLPLFGAVSVASELATETCQCPQVKCPGDDPVALCNCLNSRETLCKKRCPKYEPTYLPCPVRPSPTLSPTISAKPTTKPKTCECPLVNCLAIWPGGCHCQNTAAQNCYDKCGGEPPKVQDCSIDTTFPQPSSEPEPTCECEGIMCIQMWPESCYCANAAAQACYAKCGGPKPDLQTCPPQSSLSLTKITKPTPTATSLPVNPHKICGGGRANYLQCDEGWSCITDPYTLGCGPACDALGICVKNEMCGGFMGLPCKDKTQVCLDDPRDECDPKTGGADCAGVCVWPHRSLTEGEE